jgi:hypothetical protein
MDKISSTATKSFSSPKCPDLLWGPPSHIFNEYEELFSLE